MSKKSQADCLKKFITLCREMSDGIDEIDKETPWSTHEPNWWVRMMLIQSDLKKVINDD